MKKILFSTFLFLPVISFASMLDFPMAFWGTVTIDGAVAPVGTVIRVYDDSAKVGEVSVKENGVYGYTELTKQKLIVGSGQGELVFKVQSPSINNGLETGGITAVTYSGFVSGETVNKDLVFDVTTDIVENSGGAGSSSSGGGGGSSRKKKTEAEELVLGVSTTTPTSTLSEEEQKIILQKKLIELLTLLVSLLQQKY